LRPMASETLLTVAERLRAVCGAVDEAARRAGRDPGSVRVVAITKTVEAERILEAYEAGARIFGENYLQELLSKVDRLPRDVRWHMTGHLQTNKAKRAVDVFSVVQTLDRPSLADALEKAARDRGMRVDVLIQVNIGAEATKYGATPEAGVELARRASEWPSLRICGLMAIPPYRPEAEESRPHFRALRELGERIAAFSVPGVGMGELSMGMSHDFEVAVEEGATLVRVGTAIFGERGR
jgi:pyridoxal phosphate enzyme (YggS family)